MQGVKDGIYNAKNDGKKRTKKKKKSLKRGTQDSNLECKIKVKSKLIFA